MTALAKGAYRWLDIDLDAPVSAVTFTSDEVGWAVLVRREGRPLTFWIEPVAAGSHFSASELQNRVVREAGHAIVQDQLRRYLDLNVQYTFPTLSIAVCTHARPERLARCLEALQRLSIPGGMEAPETLVVDNAPPDTRTRDIVATRPEVKYVIEPIPGLNFGRNRALAEATGEWIAYIDDDVVPDRSWLNGLAVAWRDHPDARAVTGLVLPYALETEAQVLFERAGGFRRGCETIRHEPDKPNDPRYPAGAGIFGAGANMAFHRETIQGLGGFDEALDTGPPLPGGGDLDAFYSILRSGHPLIYEPSALVFHEHRRDMDGLRHQYYTWGLGFMAYVGKHLRREPEMGSRFRSLIKWWRDYQRRTFLASVRGRHVLPPNMVWAEWRGGLIGMTGEYRRSQRRVAERRRITRSIESTSAAPTPQL